MEHINFEPIPYQESFEPLLLEFLEKCLPESGRCLEIDGRHSYYKHIPEHFKAFWCMFDGDDMIGTAAFSELDNTSCELKSLYLYEKYHGKGLGRKLINRAIESAKNCGYEKMYLDTFSTSTKAIALYRKTGFVDTEKYNAALRSDVFMMLELR